MRQRLPLLLAILIPACASMHDHSVPGGGDGGVTASTNRCSIAIDVCKTASVDLAAGLADPNNATSESACLTAAHNLRAACALPFPVATSWHVNGALKSYTMTF